jgi:hypothetical protein
MKMPGGRKSKSFKQATDMAVDGAYQDLVVPNRAKGDPTGQSTALGNQIDAVEPQTQSPILAGASTMPMVGDIFNAPTQLPDQPGFVPEQDMQVAAPVQETQITKQLITERFPELRYRFN